MREQIQQRHPKSILTKKETAIEMGISEATLDRLRRSGDIISKKIGGGVFFKISEIASFIEA